MGNINLFVDDEDIAAAEAASQFTFEIPSDAVQRGNLKDPNDDKARAEWIQRLQVVESKMSEDTTKDKDQNTYQCVTVELKFQVPPDAVRVVGEQAVPDPNAGRSTTQWYRIVPSVGKNKQHPKYKANNFSRGKLIGIARSAWGTAVIPHGGGTDLAALFGSPGDGQAPPIVNQFIVANMRQSKYEGKPQDQLTDLVPLEMQG